MLVHSFFGVIICMAGAFVQIRYIQYRNSDLFYYNETAELTELKREMVVWMHTEQNMATAHTSEEDLIHKTIHQKIDDLNKRIALRTSSSIKRTSFYETTLLDLQTRVYHIILMAPSNIVGLYYISFLIYFQFPIRDKELLIYCVLVLSLFLTFFALNSVPGVRNLSVGWITMLCFILLLILFNGHDLDHCLHQVEWPTLLFFANLFILMECLTEIGLIPAIGTLIEKLIMSMSPGTQFPVAIVLILWVSHTLLFSNFLIILELLFFLCYISFRRPD